MKPDWVIRVIRVTFCPGQVGLARFIKYLGLTRILHGSRVLIMASVPNQSNELSMLDDDDGSVFLDFFTIIILKD